MISDIQKRKANAAARVAMERFGRDGRAWCFVEILNGNHFGLGVAEFGIGGYSPLPCVMFDTFDDAGATADTLNAALLGLTSMEALRIVADTMKRPAGMVRAASFLVGEVLAPAEG